MSAQYIRGTQSHEEYVKHTLSFTGNSLLANCAPMTGNPLDPDSVHQE